MTRKQWINTISDEEVVKIHTTFRQIDKTLFAVPVFSLKQTREVQKHYKTVDDGMETYKQHRRTVVRNFLRKNKIGQRELNVQYGRLAAGLGLNLQLKVA